MVRDVSRSIFQLGGVEGKGDRRKEGPISIERKGIVDDATDVSRVVIPYG